MDAISFKSGLRNLANEYELGVLETVDIVSDTLSQVLLTRYPDQRISVYIAPDFSEINLTGYGNAYDSYSREIPLKKLTGIKNLHKHIRNALDLAVAYRQLSVMRKRKHTMVRGTVLTHRPDGKIYIEMDIDAPIEVPLIGMTRRELIPKNEYHLFRPGYTAYFHLRDCRLNAIGDLLRIDVLLDRISKTLTELVVEHILAKDYPELATRVRVTVRYRRSGEITELWANEQLPSQLRKDVERLFPGEKILVYTGQSKQEINLRKGKNSRRKRRFHKKSQEIR